MAKKPAETLDQKTLQEAINWALEYFKNPNGGNHKSLPSEDQLESKFPGSGITQDLLEFEIKNLLGVDSLEDIKPESQEVEEVLEETKADKKEQGKETKDHLDIDVGEAPDKPAPKARGKVSAFGVLAEIESIEPILNEHKQNISPSLQESLEPQIRKLMPLLGVKITDDRIIQEIAQETVRQTLEDVARIQSTDQIPHVVADSLTQTLFAHPDVAPQIKLDEEGVFNTTLQDAASVIEPNEKALEKAAVLGNLAQIARLKNPNQETLELMADQVEETTKVEAALTPPETVAAFHASLKELLPEYQDQLASQMAAFSDKNLPTFDQLQKAKEIAHNMAVAKLEPKNKNLYAQTQDRVTFRTLSDKVAGTLGTKPLSQNRIEGLGLGRAKPKSLAQGIASAGANMLISSSDSFLGSAFQIGRAFDEGTMERDIRHLLENIMALKKRKPGLEKEKKLRQAQKKLQRLQEAKNLVLKNKDTKPKDNSKFKNMQRILQTFGMIKVSSTFRETDLAMSGAYPGVWVPQSLANNPYLIANRAFGSLAFRLGRFSLSGSPLVTTRQALYSGASGIRRLAGGFFITLAKIPFVGPIFAPLGNSLMGVSKVAGAVGSAKKLAGVAKMANPVGAAITLAGSKTFRKIAKGAAAFIGGMMLLFGMKILGALAGITFGAITGLPLLFVPVAGPFLYAGWVAAWGYFGFTNPFQMISISLNPTAALSSVWHTITSPFTSATTTASSAIGSVVGTVGSFVTGLGSSLVGGLSSAVGGTFGFITGAGNGLLSLAGINFSGTFASIPVAGAMGAVGITTVVVGTITTASFFSLATDENLPFTPGENEFFTLTKSANPTSLQNPPPNQEITYEVKLTAKGIKLTNVVITDQIKVQGANSHPDVTTDKNGTTISPLNCPAELVPNESCTVTFTINVDDSFKDTVVINTATAKVTPEGQPEQTESVTATTAIGTPPAECPNRWPTVGDVTQGPDGPTSHGPAGYEALDIGQGTSFGGDPKDVVSTIEGVVQASEPRSDPMDQRIIVQPLQCAGLQLVFFTHLSRRDVSVGDTVHFGQVIGRTGAPLGDGGIRQPHLHYQFNNTSDRSFKMEPPNIPASVPRACNGSDECHTHISSAP